MQTGDNSVLNQPMSIFLYCKTFLRKRKFVAKNLQLSASQQQRKLRFLIRLLANILVFYLLTHMAFYSDKFFLRQDDQTFWLRKSSGMLMMA